MLKKLFALTLVILVAGAAVVAYLGPTAAFGLVLQAYGDYQYEQMKNEEPHDDLGYHHPANNHSTNPDWVAYEHPDVENLWVGDKRTHYYTNRVLYKPFNVGHDSYLMDTVARGVAADAGQNGVTETVVNESWVAPADVPGECVGRSLVYTTEVVVVNDTIQYRYSDHVAEILKNRMMNDSAVQDFFTGEPVAGGVGVWAEFEETGEAGVKGQYYVAVTVCDDESQ
jgi:hypothetical protein